MPQNTSLIVNCVPFLQQVRLVVAHILASEAENDWSQCQIADAFFFNLSTSKMMFLGNAQRVFPNLLSLIKRSNFLSWISSKDNTIYAKKLHAAGIRNTNSDG